MLTFSGSSAFPPAATALRLSYTNLQDGWPPGISQYPVEPGTRILAGRLYLPTGTESYNDGLPRARRRRGHPLFGSLRLPSVGNSVTTGDPGRMPASCRPPRTTYLGATPSPFDIRYSRQLQRFRDAGAVLLPGRHLHLLRHSRHARAGLGRAERSRRDRREGRRDRRVAPARMRPAGKAVDRSATHAIEAGTPATPPTWAAAASQSPVELDRSPSSREVTGWTELNFETHWHPYVEELIKALYRQQSPSDTTGVAGLMNLVNQSLGNPYLATPWTRCPGRRALSPPPGRHPLASRHSRPRWCRRATAAPRCWTSKP